MNNAERDNRRSSLISDTRQHSGITLMSQTLFCCFPAMMLSSSGQSLTVLQCSFNKRLMERCFGHNVYIGYLLDMIMTSSKAVYIIVPCLNKLLVTLCVA